MRISDWSSDVCSSDLDLIRASGGTNVALDYLPGAINFDPLVEQPDALLASSIDWFDAFVANVDRTARNIHLLLWHCNLHLIDRSEAHMSELQFIMRIPDDAIRLKKQQIRRAQSNTT